MTSLMLARSRHAFPADIGILPQNRPLISPRTSRLINYSLVFFYRCTVYSDIHRVHSPTNALLLI